MIHKNQIEPMALSRQAQSIGSNPDFTNENNKSFRDVNDVASTSTFNLDESSYLKLRPFKELDPTLERLIKFLKCFGITVNYDPSIARKDGKKKLPGTKERKLSYYFWTAATMIIIVLTGEVVYDVNLRQSKLLAEQKRSTPLLTSVIVAYSWLTLVIPIICDINLMIMGSHLFCFYSRTTATICNGK